MWPCDTAGCTKTAVRIQGQCFLCNEHICARHLEPDYHKCPAWEVSTWEPATSYPDLASIALEPR